MCGCVKVVVVSVETKMIELSIYSLFTLTHISSHSAFNRLLKGIWQHNTSNSNKPIFTLHKRLRQCAQSQPYKQIERKENVRF